MARSTSICSMKMGRAMVMLTALVAICACKQTSSPCPGAMRHYYDRFCVAFDHQGVQIDDVESAIARCDWWEQSAHNYGCEDEFQAVISCYGGIDYRDCDLCLTQAAAFNDCLSAAWPPACEGYTGDDGCCRTDDICYRLGNGICDCEGFCSWEETECGP